MFPVQIVFATIVAVGNGKIVIIALPLIDVAHAAATLTNAYVVSAVKADVVKVALPEASNVMV